MKIFGSDKKQTAKEKEASTVPSEKEKGTTKTASQKKAAGGGRYIIKSPLLTEKAAIMQEVASKYVFVVHPEANKSEIKKEVERLFDVKVENVNIINQPRKRHVWRGHVGFSSGEKKAIVTIEEGKKIEILPT